MRSKVSVMIVEDNPGDLTLIRESCLGINPNCEFMVARDGEEAFTMVNGLIEGDVSKYPDFIILDLNLPKRDGREILNQIKSDPQMRMVPVVVFSSSSGSMDVQGAYQRYANTYMVKPFNLDDFEQAIQRIYDFWVKASQSPYQA